MQRMAGSMDPAMMQQAMAQMQNMTPDQMAQMRAGVSGMSPDAFTSAAASTMGQAGSSRGSQPSAAAGPELEAAAALKAEGNKLHGARQFGEAAQKYEAALRSLQGVAAGGTGSGAAHARLHTPLPAQFCSYGVH